MDRLLKLQKELLEMFREDLLKPPKREAKELLRCVRESFDVSAMADPDMYSKSIWDPNYRL